MSLLDNHQWRSLVHRRMTIQPRRLSAAEVAPAVPAVPEEEEEMKPMEEEKKPLGFFATVMGASKIVQQRRQLQLKQQAQMAAASEIPDANVPARVQQKNQNAKRFAKLMTKKAKTRIDLDEAEVAPALPSRSQSAPPRLGFGSMTAAQKRRAMETLSAARSVRKAFQRRSSYVRPATEEHEKEWATIRYSIRKTKEMKLSDTHQRVQKMLMEMSRESGCDDFASSGIASEFQAVRQLRNLLSRQTTEIEGPSSALAHEARKKVLESMQKDMDRGRKTRSLLAVELISRAQLAKARDRRQDLKAQGTDDDPEHIKEVSSNKAAYRSATRKLNEVSFEDIPEDGSERHSRQWEEREYCERSTISSRGTLHSARGTLRSSRLTGKSQDRWMPLSSFLRTSRLTERGRHTLARLNLSSKLRKNSAIEEDTFGIVGVNMGATSELQSELGLNRNAVDSILQQEKEVRDREKAEQVRKRSGRLRTWTRFNRTKQEETQDIAQEMESDALALIASLDVHHRSSIKRLNHIVKTLKRWQHRPTEFKATCSRRTQRRAAFSAVVAGEAQGAVTPGHALEVAFQSFISEGSSGDSASQAVNSEAQSRSTSRPLSRESPQRREEEEDAGTIAPVSEKNHDICSTVLQSALSKLEEAKAIRAKIRKSQADTRAKMNTLYLRSGQPLPAGWSRLQPKPRVAATPAPETTEPARQFLVEPLDGEEPVDDHSKGLTLTRLLPSFPAGSRLRSRSEAPARAEEAKQPESSSSREVHMEVLREHMHKRFEREFRRHCRLWKKWLRHELRQAVVSSEGELGSQPPAGPRAPKIGKPESEDEQRRSERESPGLVPAALQLDGLEGFSTEVPAAPQLGGHAGLSTEGPTLVPAATQSEVHEGISTGHEGISKEGPALVPAATQSEVHEGISTGHEGISKETGCHREEPPAEEEEPAEREGRPEAADGLPKDDKAVPFDVIERGTEPDATRITETERPDGFAIGLQPPALEPRRPLVEEKEENIATPLQDGAVLPAATRPDALFGIKPLPRLQMKTSVDQYLKSFEGGDLNTLLEEISRPGTCSRPGTKGVFREYELRASSARGEDKALDGSCSANPNADKDFGGAWPADMNTMVSIWPEFAWPGSPRVIGAAPDSVHRHVGGQVGKLRPAASGASTRTGTSSSPKSSKAVSSLALPALTGPPSMVSTTDSWRRALTSRESPSWMKGGLEGLTSLPSTLTTVAQAPQSGRRAVTAAPLSARATSIKLLPPVPVDRADAHVGAAAPAKGPRWKARPGTVASCQAATRQGQRSQMDKRALA